MDHCLVWGMTFIYQPMQTQIIQVKAILARPMSVL